MSVELTQFSSLTCCVTNLGISGPLVQLLEAFSDVVVSQDIEGGELSIEAVEQVYGSATEP